MVKKSKISLFSWVVLNVVGLIFFISGPANAVAPVSTISYWKLDETAPVAPTTPGTYTDSVGSNEGASTGVSPTESPAPSDPTDPDAAQVGGALVFDGSNTGIEVPANASFDWSATDSFSIESWAKPPTGLPGSTEVFVGRTDPDPAGDLDWWVALRPTTGFAGFRLVAKNGDGDLIEGTTDLTDNDWHHIVGVRDADTDTPPVGTISHWKLDETAPVTSDAPGTYTDSVGSNNGASTGVAPTTSPIPETGQVGGALVFDGSDTGIEVPADASFNWLATDSFSIEAWVKPPTGLPGSTEVFVGRTDPDPAGDLDWWIGIRPTTGFAGFNLVAKNGDGDLIEGTTDLTDNAWHHVVAVRNAVTGRNILYVDGAQKASKAVSYNAATGFDSLTLPLKIGHFDPADNHFDGSLDEIAIYDRALSATEISEHYQAGLSNEGINTVATNYLYVDGLLEAAGAFDYDPTTGFDSATLPLKIGHFDPADNHFDGSLDEIAIFDTALTAAEVDDHYQAGLAGDGIDTLLSAPVANAVANPSTVTEGATVTLDGSGSTDADGTIASYLWVETTTTGAGATLSDATAESPTFTAPQVTGAAVTVTFELTVTDNDDLDSTPDSVSVTVNDSAAAQPPTANAVANPSTVTEGATVTLVGTGSSAAPGKTIASYQWVETTTTGVTLIPNATAESPTFTAPQVTGAAVTVTFELTVTDNDGLASTPASVSVIVNDNPAGPTANAGPDQTVAPGAAVTLDGTASTGTNPTYAWIQTAGTPVQLAGDDTASPTFTAPTAAEISAAVLDTLTFELTVTDANGSTTDGVNVIVDDSVGRGGGGGGGGGGCFINSMF